MPDMSSTPHDGELVRELDAQKRRLMRLQERHALMRQEAERRTRELDQWRAEARAQFGTDDVEALRRLLAERHARNQEAVRDFAAALDEVERRLAVIEAEEGAAAR